MNVFAEESTLPFAVFGDPWSPDHYYETTDGKYRIRQEPSPWAPDDESMYVWIVEVLMYGERFRRTIKSKPTFADAVAFCERDNESPVWDDHGDCRWCGIDKADLAAYPRWWFGCNLCEKAIAAEDAAPTDCSDNEFEPRHD